MSVRPNSDSSRGRFDPTHYSLMEPSHSDSDHLKEWRKSDSRKRELHKADRFIPSRRAMEMAGSGTFGATYSMKPPETLYEKWLAEALFPYYTPRTLLYAAPHRYTFAAKAEMVKWSFPRHKERVLDAPNVCDDFYRRNLDWGPESLVGVNLGNASYIRNNISGVISQCPAQPVDLCSIKWNPVTAEFASGDENSTLILTDAIAMARIQQCSNVDGTSVLSIGWRTPTELTVGTDSGGIHHFDTRIRRRVWTFQTSINAKNSAIEWNRDGSLFATGANDNVVRIYDVRNTEAPKQFNSYSHNAAVKALHWMPGNPSLLLSGGGTADKVLKIMNVALDEMVCEREVRAQICSVCFLDNQYFVLGLGYGTDTPVQIWRYVPTLKKIEKVAVMPHVQGRALDVAKDPLSPEFCALSTDETLSFWLPRIAEKEEDGKGLIPGLRDPLEISLR